MLYEVVFKEEELLKSIYSFFLLLAVVIGFTYGACSSCSVSNKDAAIPLGNFIIKVNQDGIIDGPLLASCGMCNFGTIDKTCSLSIQINKKAYSVKGTHIDDHGDSHAKDGFCNAVRVAKVSGNVDKDDFIAETFTLQKN